jgi:hypothetical protein
MTSSSVEVPTTTAAPSTKHNAKIETRDQGRRLLLIVGGTEFEIESMNEGRDEIHRLLDDGHITDPEHVALCQRILHFSRMPGGGREWVYFDGPALVPCPLLSN